MRRLAALVLAALSLGAASPEPVALDALLAETPAPTLDAYRLFTEAGTPNGRVTPYALNTPLFSDYAEKARFVFLPPGAQARYTASGVLDFPVGATLVKTFAYPADLRRPDEQIRKVETRLLIRRASGWAALTYVWNPEQTQAVLKRAGARLPMSVVGLDGRKLEFDYAVPNVNQCKECHSVGGVLEPIGPRARNLNGAYAYGTGTENQLVHWSRTGMLEGAPADPPRMPDWSDARESLDARARAYLDGNCAHCHNPQGLASNSGLFLQWEETDPTRRGVGKRPVAAGRGSGGLAVDIAPGRPEASILLYRMQSREPGVMMPELGRTLPHAEGVALIEAWLKSLPPAEGS